MRLSNPESRIPDLEEYQQWQSVPGFFFSQRLAFESQRSRPAWSRGRMGVPVFAALGSSAADELAYVPSDAHLVAYADLREVMNSPLRNKLEQLQRDNSSNADGLEARTGINLETDIDRVVVAVTGGDGTDRRLLVARGRFDVVKIEGLMREQGADAEQYRGSRLVFIKDDMHDAALAFVETGVVLFGDGAAVRRRSTPRRELPPTSPATGSSWSWLATWTMPARGRWRDSMCWRDAPPSPRMSVKQLPPINWVAASGRVGCQRARPGARRSKR
jgi:hypothetical protein